MKPTGTSFVRLSECSARGHALKQLLWTGRPAWGWREATLSETEESLGGDRRSHDFSRVEDVKPQPVPLSLSLRPHLSLGRWLAIPQGTAANCSGNTTNLPDFEGACLPFLTAIPSPALNVPTQCFHLGASTEEAPKGRTSPSSCIEAAGVSTRRIMGAYRGATAGGKEVIAKATGRR